MVKDGSTTTATTRSSSEQGSTVVRGGGFGLQGGGGGRLERKGNSSSGVLANARDLIEKLDGIACAYESIVQGLCATLEDSDTEECVAMMSKKHAESTKSIYMLIKKLNDQLQQKEYETEVLRRTAESLEESLQAASTNNACDSGSDSQAPPIREISFSHVIVDVSKLPKENKRLGMLKKSDSVRLLL